MAYRQSDVDGWSDRLNARWMGAVMDEWSEVNGQSYRWGNMAYRQSDVDGWSDRLITGQMGRVMDGWVNDSLTC